MTYGYDDEFSTAGEEFVTVGYDQWGTPILGARTPSGGDPRRQRNPGQMPRRGAPPPQRGSRMLPPPGGRTGTPSEARIIEVVNEELNRRLPDWFQGASRVPGSSDAAQLMSPLGLGAAQLTNAVAVVTLSAQPQRPFRGERLLISLARSAGALVVPVRVSEFKIGENSQLVGAGALPAEAFSPDAFGVRLAMSPSAPGILINLRIETDVGAVPAGETITVTAAIIGRAVWGEAGGPG
jgi:hypothetical protein